MVLSVIFVSQAQQHSTLSLFLSNKASLVQYPSDTCFCHCEELSFLVIARSVATKQSHRVNGIAQPRQVGAGGRSMAKMPLTQIMHMSSPEQAQPFSGQVYCRGTFYLTLKGLIKINDIATLETLPLEHGMQFFVTVWNQGTNRSNIFGLAMIQDRLN